MARAPWAVTTIVSCLPVLVLAMGTTLAHMLRADATPRGRTGHPGPQDRRVLVPARPGGDRDGPARDQAAGLPTSGCGPPARTRTVSKGVHGTADRTRRPTPAEISQARLIASRLTAAGRPDSGVPCAVRGQGSNQALNAWRPGSTPSWQTLQPLPAVLEDAALRSWLPEVSRPVAPAGGVVHCDATGRTGPVTPMSTIRYGQAGSPDSKQGAFAQSGPCPLCPHSLVLAGERLDAGPASRLLRARCPHGHLGLQSACRLPVATWLSSSAWREGRGGSARCRAAAVVRGHGNPWHGASVRPARRPSTLSCTSGMRHSIRRPGLDAGHAPGRRPIVLQTRPRLRSDGPCRNAS